MENPEPNNSRLTGTNKDGPPKRTYTLSAEGLASLRAAARRNRPWEQSTGPQTTAGKARSRMNAYKHGADSEHERHLRRVQRLLIRKYSTWSGFDDDAIDAEIRQAFEDLEAAQRERG